MTVARIDCSNLQSVDNGRRINFGGNIIIENLGTGKKHIIECEDVDCPGEALLDYWPTIFGFTTENIEENDLIDLFLENTETLGVPGRITLITAKQFKINPKDDQEKLDQKVMDWIAQIKYEEQNNGGFTLEELNLISGAINQLTILPAIKSIKNKLDKMIEEKS